MTKDIHMLVSMINMKLRDDDMKLVHALSIYDLKEDEFLKRLDENISKDEQDILQFELNQIIIEISRLKS